MKRIVLLFLSLILSGLAWPQDVPKNLTLIVAGQPGQIPIVHVNGKPYVDVDALARLTNSSVNFKGNQVILTPLVRPRARRRRLPNVRPLPGS